MTSRYRADLDQRLDRASGKRDCDSIVVRDFFIKIAGADSGMSRKGAGGFWLRQTQIDLEFYDIVYLYPTSHLPHPTLSLAFLF